MKKTHLGVSAHDLVLLETVGVANSADTKEALAFQRIKYGSGNYASNKETAGYTPPKGKALIITEVDWQYEYGKPGENVTLRLFLSWPPKNSGIERRVLESTILLGLSGGGGISTIETTGIVVVNGVQIVIDVAGSGATGKIQHVLLRGYLTDFK